MVEELEISAIKKLAQSEGKIWNGKQVAHEIKTVDPNASLHCTKLRKKI
jgi:hypothetical protein